MRLGLTFAASQLEERGLKIMGSLAVVAGLLMIWVWLGGQRRDRGFFGGEVWWDGYRPIHGLIWIIFGALALMGR